MESDDDLNIRVVLSPLTYRVKGLRNYYKVQNMEINISGYQIGVLYALSSNAGDNRLIIRSIDKWYCEVCQELFRVNIYPNNYHYDRDKATQWCLKGTLKVPFPKLEDITDIEGFCRSWIEIHSCLDKPRDKLRLRIYGKEEILKFLIQHLPVAMKKIQNIRTQTGITSAVYYQSRKEIINIFDYINGYPKNDKVWDKWNKIIEF